ncbi:ABC transporter substrate-binding protein [Massilia antarctica]|uniref:ABC transporter substrate-binding protein n=1 Tax=Massilia antarctica TaxID=2765360 RepID=UPI0006BB9217|nr:ABC transporter substrate-binding protein [Massilia sp. H27-R4]MCY0915071.1 ABC transporter substrate-binding protein [Massilia sp. H27-R4]CUI07046.1 ABC-type sugar transport system, periplasmic component [Janthinobacterium sp. CG23_2]CUU30832.1 ABC-type sugar transport system, periplasmic component [Janthinobacterium sp. CG23_2]
MHRAHKLALAAALALGACAMAHAAGPQAERPKAGAPRAEVIHWWTSGGESAAVKTIADAYRAAGGVWVDTAVAGNEQARAVAVNRIVGGNPPAAAQFNASMQFLDLVEQGMLNQVDDIAATERWDSTLPAPIRDVIKVKGHYYAVPLNVHMPTWIWYSRAAFKQAGIAREPATMDELFAALDKLKAAGLIPLAHGGQSWQENIVFMAVLANVGGKDLYLSVLRERDPRAIGSEPFKQVLLAFKRLKSYVDPGSPGRNWNDATALLVSGKAGVQIMGDWVKGELNAAKLTAGKEYGCITGFGPRAPFLIQGDAFIFPKSANADTAKAQKLLAGVMVAPATVAAFNRVKGSLPVRADLDASALDACAQAALVVMKDRTRHVGNGEVYLTPDQNGALVDVLTAYWNTAMPVEKAQKNIAAALKG